MTGQGLRTKRGVVAEAIFALATVLKTDGGGCTIV